MIAFPVPSWSFPVPTENGAIALISKRKLKHSRFALLGPSWSAQAIDFAKFLVPSRSVSLSPHTPHRRFTPSLRPARRLKTELFDAPKPPLQRP
jgi:hypothetical protein